MKLYEAVRIKVASSITQHISLLMKKLLLIPSLMVAAVAVASAHCGTCGHGDAAEKTSETVTCPASAKPECDKKDRAECEKKQAECDKTAKLECAKAAGEKKECPKDQKECPKDEKDSEDTASSSLVPSCCSKKAHTGA